MEIHDGCVHRGLRYTARLRQLPPVAYIAINRNDCTSVDGVCQISQYVPFKLFGVTVGHDTRSLTEIVELAIAKIREYDAVVETYAPEEEEE